MKSTWIGVVAFAVASLAAAPLRAGQRDASAEPRPPGGHDRQQDAHRRGIREARPEHRREVRHRREHLPEPAVRQEDDLHALDQGPVAAKRADAAFGAEALQWTVEDGVVRILPSEPLYRMCRRATREELLCLGRICWDQDQAGKGKLTASTKTDTAGQLADLTAQLRKITEDEALEIVFRVPDEKVGEAVAHGQKALPASGGEFLDALTQGQGWTWYLDGGRLIVLDSRKQVERQLGRQFTAEVRGHVDQRRADRPGAARPQRFSLRWSPACWPPCRPTHATTSACG